MDELIPEMIGNLVYCAVTSEHRSDHHNKGNITGTTLYTFSVISFRNGWHGSGEVGLQN